MAFIDIVIIAHVVYCFLDIARNGCTYTPA